MTEARVFANSATRLTTSIHKKYLSIGNEQMLSLILFASGFFAVQRFTISPINAVICTIPLGLFAVQMLRGHHQTALTYLVLALFLSIDNGGGAYAETIAPLRYLIYMSAITMLFYLSSRRIQPRRLLLAALLCFGIVIGSVTTLFGSVPIDLATLKRDLMVLIILSAFLIDRSSAKLDLHLLYLGSLGYLVGEVVNGLFFYSGFNDYLSYDSLKVFVIFPIVFAILTRKNTIVQVALAFATLFVIFLYGSRMITLTTITLFIVGSIIGIVRNRRRKSLIGFLMGAVLIITFTFPENINDGEFARFKALSFFGRILENIKSSDVLDIFALLDPVRFAEHQLFFSRSIFEIVFGNGLGSGIFDRNGILGSINVGPTAFTDIELNSSTYFNFHDFWIDFGLRFGLLPIICLLFVLIFFPMIRGEIMRGILHGLVLLNATFSTSGILLIALLVRFWPLEHHVSGTKTLKSDGCNS